MCGITGIIGRGGHQPAGIERMLTALRHRGPDGEGVFVDSCAALGHRRLSIIDLNGGKQPLSNAQGTVHLICNGEIYNYQSLRGELEREGYRFRTGSDCEVILALYERDGDKLLQHLRGMFAFALWDAPRKRLLAARDHLGQKPFFYAETAQGFAFASEIKALLALDETLRELDIGALDQYLALRLIAPPLTMFKRIRKLPPGHLLVLEQDGEPRIESYWTLKFTPKITGSEEELTDALEERLDETLRLHLVSDVQVGAFLSGGLDSSLLVAMLAKRVGYKHLPTFTIGLSDKFDETPYAAQVARLYATDHHEQRIKPNLSAHLPALVWHLDEPSDPLSLCAYNLAQLASRHVKVAIGGDGGDELFGGYDRYYGNIYAGHYGLVPQSVREHVLGPMLHLVPANGWYKSVGHQLRWLHRLSFLEGGERYASSLSYFYFDEHERATLLSSAAIEALAGRRGEDTLKAAFENAEGDVLDRMLCADSKIRLPDHPVMITDRMTMAHGLETRSPFMDHRLAEFAASLPASLKVRGRSLRYIQRKLAARYLPQSILERPKQGFSSALPYILRNEYRMLYRHLLTESELAKADIINGFAVLRLLHEHISGRADHGNRLWLLLNAELWYRMLILGQGREDIEQELRAGCPAHAA
jgi:asparagine synthase (glutamine-hydrolysing)